MPTRVRYIMPGKSFDLGYSEPSLPSQPLGSWEDAVLHVHAGHGQVPAAAGGARGGRGGPGAPGRHAAQVGRLAAAAKKAAADGRTGLLKEWSGLESTGGRPLSSLLL